MLELSAWFHGVHPFALLTPDLLGKAFRQRLLTCTMLRRELLPTKGGDICDSPVGSAVQWRLGLYSRSRMPDQPFCPSDEIPCLSKSEKRDAITGRVLFLQQSLEVFCHFRPARLDGLQKSDGFVVSLSTSSFAKAGATSGV